MSTTKAHTDAGWGIDHRNDGAQDLDELVDGGEWSGPAAARKLERAHEQLFLETANEYNVDVSALKGAVYDLLNEAG